MRESELLAAPGAFAHSPCMKWDLMSVGKRRDAEMSQTDRSAWLGGHRQAAGSAVALSENAAGRVSRGKAADESKWVRFRRLPRFNIGKEVAD